MILVTGANGRTGRAVVELLHRRGTPVRAMVRDRAKATGLPAGPEIAVADFGQPQTLPAILDGIDEVYLTSAPDPEQVPPRKSRRLCASSNDPRSRRSPWKR
jgi:uncharacterized protein YbjT (DUF2867 family)